MITTTRTSIALIAIAATALLGFAGEGGTVRVSGDTAAAENDQGGWLFNRDTANATPIAFDEEQASIGDGSLHVLPIGATPAHKFIGEYFVLAEVSDVVSVSYDFLLGANSTGATAYKQFYMNVYANFAGGDQTRFGDCVYNVLPTGAAGWTTVTFDPGSSYGVRTRGTAPTTCPGSPSALPAGSTIRAAVINLGDQSANDVGMDGYFDNVVLTTSTATTVYDFEAPYVVPSTKDDCKKGGYVNYTDNDGNPFTNQGQCVSWVNHNT